MRRLIRFEPLLILLAAPPLVLRERFGVAVQVLALAYLAGLWLIRRRATGRWTVRTVLDAPTIALLLTLPGAIYAARQTAPDIGLAAAVSRAESLIFAMALAYALANAVGTPRRLWSAVTAALIATLGLVALALVSVGWLEKYGALAPILARFPRLIQGVPHATLEIYGVAGGVAVHPNTIAALLILVLPLALACLVWTTSGEVGGPDPSEDLAPPRWIRPLAAVVLAIGGTMLVLTQSRGAWLGMAAALVGMAAVRFRAVRALVAGAGVTAVLWVLAVGPGNVLARLGASGLPGAASAAGRLDLWREALALLYTSPALGIGLNTFVVAHGRRPEYQGGFVYQGLPHAHNTLLQAALDYGLPGLVAVVGLGTALAWAAWRAHRRLRGTRLDAVVIGLAFGLLAHAVHGLVDAVAIGAKVGLAPWALAGLLAGLRARAHRWNATGERRRRTQTHEPDVSRAHDPGLAPPQSA